ncbi:MAG: PilZ domain-containing protein [Candidatus Eremiobacteraeota bacterium]|nr:PilZ domain-containing protein [Candidatus Eremiobacteraeota bacterium]
MLGFFGPETGQFFHMDGPTLSFYGKSAKKLESDVKIRLPLKGYSKAKHVDIPLKITDSQPMGKGHLNTGHVDMTIQHLRQLEDLLYNYTARPDAGEAARRSPRIPIGLKVICREVAGYNCITADISRQGVRLTCQGAVELGTRVGLEIDSDVAGLGALHLAGRVVACRETPDSRSKNKTYHVGVAFCGLTQAQQDNLDYFNRILAGRLKGDVMQRQIADGEMTAGPMPGGPVNLGAPPPPPPT